MKMIMLRMRQYKLHWEWECRLHDFKWGNGEVIWMLGTINETLLCQG